MYYMLQFIDCTVYSRVTYSFTTLTSICSDSQDSNKFNPTTLTCSLWQLWHTRFHFNSDILASTLTLIYSFPLQPWHAHFHHWSDRSHNSDIFTFQPLICVVSLLWHGHSRLSDNYSLISSHWVEVKAILPAGKLELFNFKLYLPTRSRESMYPPARSWKSLTKNCIILWPEVDNLCKADSI